MTSSKVRASGKCGTSSVPRPSSVSDEDRVGRRWRRRWSCRRRHAVDQDPRRRQRRGLLQGCERDRHQRASSSTSRKVGLPGFTVRARSKAVRMGAARRRTCAPGPGRRCRRTRPGRRRRRGSLRPAWRARLVPLDLLRQVGDDRDLVVVEADGAGVLALGAAGGGGAVAVAERDGAVAASRRACARPSRRPRPPPAAARASAAGSAAISPIGMVRMSPSWGRLAGAFTTRPPR